MGWWSRVLGRDAAPAPEVRALTPANASALMQSSFLEFLGLSHVDLPAVTIESALETPAVAAVISFLPRCLASLPLLLYQSDGSSAEKIDSGLAVLLRDAPNPELTSFDWRKWFWEQVFTGGRGLSWIERNGAGQVAGIWPMDPRLTRIERRNGRLLYFFQGQGDPYPAADVIDFAWMMRADMVGHYSPIQRGAKAIGKALAMMDYGARLFSKGGVPPLVLEGPMGTGAEAMRRAMEDVKRSIEIAAEKNIPMVQLPAGYTLKPIGFNPRDGQMVEESKAINLDIARLYNLPPVFLQDLQFSTFTNSEQQDLQLVKHLVRSWAEGFEQQLNLKLFGQKRAARRVRHDVTELMRGDFKSLMEGLAQGVQTSLLTPNEGREKLDLPPSADPAADRLHMQGATVPIGTTGGSDGGTGNAN